MPCFAYWSAGLGEPPAATEDDVKVDFIPVPCFAIVAECAAEKGERCRPDEYEQIVPCVPGDYNYYSPLGDDDSEAGNSPFLGMWYGREGDKNIDRWKPAAMEAFRRAMKKKPTGDVAKLK